MDVFDRLECDGLTSSLFNSSCYYGRYYGLIFSISFSSISSACVWSLWLVGHWYSICKFEVPAVEVDAASKFYYSMSLFSISCDGFIIFYFTR